MAQRDTRGVKGTVRRPGAPRKGDIPNIQPYPSARRAGSHAARPPVPGFSSAPGLASGPPAQASAPFGADTLPARPPGFPTVELLERQEAATSELRTDLEQLRRLLDVEPVRPTGHRRSRRPGRLAVLVLAGATVAVGTGVLVPWSDLVGRDEPGRDVAGSTGARTPGPASAGARPALTAPAPLVPAELLPASGPGVDAPGSLAVAQLAADGTLTVVEQALLTDGGLAELRLALPPIGGLQGSTAGIHPAVKDLRIALDGRPVAPDSGDGSWVVAPDSGRATRVLVSYRLDGVTVHSVPSSTGRALVVVTPLLGELARAQGIPLRVRMPGPQVLGVACPTAPAAAQLCGELDDDQWTATVPASAATPIVLLQVDMKR